MKVIRSDSAVAVVVSMSMGSPRTRGTHRSAVTAIKMTSTIHARPATANLFLRRRRQASAVSVRPLPPSSETGVRTSPPLSGIDGRRLEGVF